MKIFVLFLIGVFGWSINSTTAGAERIEEEIVYDLEEGGRQIFVIGEGDDKEIIIVEEVIGLNDVVYPTSIGNGEYTVSRNLPLAWSASYQIRVNNNRIVSAFNATHSTVVGSITNSNLGLSNGVASYSFTYNRVLSTSINIRSEVRNGQLSIDY